MILPIIALIVLIAGSYIDIKTHEIPDFLTYSLMISALGIRLIFALSTQELTIFTEGVLGFVVCVVIGYMMYYSRQWGGADSKLLMGMGAVIGLPIGGYISELAKYLLLVIFTGGIYGISWTIALIIKHKKRVMPLIKKKFSAWSYLLLAIPFVLTHFESRIAVVGLIPFFLYIAWICAYAVQDRIFIKRVSPKDITEGDWIAKDVKDAGKIIAKRTDLGLDKNQIREIRRSNIKKVWIQEGIPFGPSFLISYSFLLILQIIMQ